jgi:hypothetical protein
MNLRINIFIIILAAIFLVAITGAQIQIPYTTVIPVIDGDRDTVWDNAFADSIKTPLQFTTPINHSDFSGEFRILWSGGGIYIFISVNDDNISTSHTTWYENDAISVFIDGRNEKNNLCDENDCQFSYVLNASELAFAVGSFPNSQIVSKETEKGYNYEIKLSAVDLRNRCNMTSTSGTHFGLDFELIDSDSGGGRDHILIYWSSNVDYWQCPVFWSTAVLIRNFAQIQIPKINKAPVIDGDMDMIYQYAAVDSIKKQHADPTLTDEDLSSEFRMLWDDNNLYLFLSVRDNDINTQKANYWENDAVQFYIDGGNEKNTEYDQNDLQFSYVFGQNGLTALWNFNYNSTRNFSIDEFTHCQFVSKMTDRGYNYEIQLAASDLALLGVSADLGTEFGWEISLIDNDLGTAEGGLTWWNPADLNWENPSCWGTARLTDFTLYPNNINLNHAINYPDKEKGSDYLATEYRLIGLPGNKHILIGDLFSGTQDKDWQVYWDNGEENDFLIEYDQSENFRCIPGRGFWVLKKGLFNIDFQNIVSTQVDTNLEAEINLHYGWNIITNPFTIPVSWSKIKEINEIDQNIPIWSYEGNWSSNNVVLEPFTGYYINNNESVNKYSLRIPYYIENPYLDKLIPTNDFQWKVSITLQEGEIIDNSCYFAVDTEAKPGLDNFEYCKPRARVIGPIPTIYFNRPKWDPSYPSFANDVRPPIQDMEEWDFQVEIPSLNHSILSFSGVEEIPQAYSVYLIDYTSAVSVNLRQQDSYAYTPYKQSASFSVIVGKDQLVQEKLENMLPIDFSLNQNFPNPFNPSTTISFTLPVQSHITLKVYNVTGQQVKSLLTKTMDAGIHHVRWDGKDDRGLKVASGLYIYRMRTAGGKNFSGKMVLLK